MPNGQSSKEPVITQILRVLIEEYGSALHLPAGDNAIARYISEKAHIAHGTVLGILNGTPQRIAVNTGNKLAEFFNGVAIPELRGEWFSSTSLDDFNNKRAGTGLVAIRVPTNHQPLIAAVSNWLCGVHIVYRYSLDSIRTGHVAREVIKITNTRSGLTYKMSFIPRAESSNDPIYYFEGPVILVGRTAVLFGTNVGKTSPDRVFDRARVIILDHGDGDPDTRDCKIGLMTSTRPRQDFAPCTASTLMVRADWASSPTAFEDLVMSATTIRPLEDIIKDDFGPSRETQALIRTFLDNRPSGCPREPELQVFEARVPKGSYDRVLRIDTARFSTHMPIIVANALKDDTICAPFKPNWPQKIKTRIASNHGGQIAPMATAPSAPKTPLKAKRAKIEAPTPAATRR